MGVFPPGLKMRARGGQGWHFAFRYPWRHVTEGVSIGQFLGPRNASTASGSWKFRYFKLFTRAGRNSSPFTQLLTPV